MKNVNENSTALLVVVEFVEKLSVRILDILVFSWSIWEIYMLTRGQYFPQGNHLWGINYHVWQTTNVDSPQVAVIFSLFAFIWVINFILRRD